MKSLNKSLVRNFKLLNMKKPYNYCNTSSLLLKTQKKTFTNSTHNNNINTNLNLIAHNPNPTIANSSNNINNNNRFMSTVAKLDANLLNKKRDLEHHVASHYEGVDYTMVDSCWGDGNYHLGYFPDISSIMNSDKVNTNVNNKNDHYDENLFDNAVHNLTKRMIQLGNINEKSRVIDFGCGRGQGTLEVAMLTNCKMLGIDIADVNMKYCNNRKKQHPELQLDFAKASFAELPESIVNNKTKFTHVFSQQSLIHCHEFIDEILDQAYQILKYDNDKNNNGKLVISDWLSLVKNPSSQVQKDVCQRLELTHILTQDEYLNKLKKHNFSIDYYEDLTEHAALSSRCIANKAKRFGYIDYYKIWNTTAEFFENREIGVNLFVASKNNKKIFN